MLNKKACFVVLILVIVVSVSANAADIFRDSFEPSISGSTWSIGPSTWGGPQGHESLYSEDSHIRTPGVNAAREQVNYRVPYNSQHSVGPYADNVYLKCWMFEDNDISFPGYFSEFTPNGFITLLDTTTANDVFSIGAMGEYGRNKTTNTFFYNCTMETASEGPKPLNGLLGTTTVPRRQGWRKYTIVLKPYTGSAGDAQFFVDDKLVYSGLRLYTPTGAAPVDTIVLGGKWWSNETYWFDDVEFGTIEIPQVCSTIGEARSKPDGTWVDLAAKVTAARFNKSPFPGYIAVEEDDRSAGLWVSTSYSAIVSTTANEAEKLSVKGIMRTNEAGAKYLDAMQITSVQTNYAQPKPLGVTLKGLGDPVIDGKLVKVWGKVTGRGQERRGDWRRYVLISDGSFATPTKCYYDNIISGVDPVPNVNTGDYVSVIGVAGSEVLISGGPRQTSVWIRKAGDLAVLRIAGSY